MSEYRWERNGEVWENTSITYMRYHGQPCNRIDMRGNHETFFTPDIVILEVCDLGDDWTRYWYTSNDPVMQALIRDTVELEERYAGQG